MTLSEKFRDPRWHKRRHEILLRDNFKCQCCFDPEKPVRVRVVIFANGIDPWNLDESGTQTICDECFQLRTDILDKVFNAARVALRDVPTEKLEQAAQKIFDEAMESI